MLKKNLLLVLFALTSCKTPKDEKNSEISSGQDGINKAIMSNFFEAMGIAENFPAEALQQEQQIKMLSHLVCNMYTFFGTKSGVEVEKIDEDQIVKNKCGSSLNNKFSLQQQAAMTKMYDVEMAKAISQALSKAGRPVNELEAELKKISEDALPFLEFTLAYLDIKEKAQTKIQQEIYFNQTKRIIFSVLANGFSNKAMDLAGYIKIGLNYLFGAHQIKWEEDFNETVIPKLEAKLLVDANDPEKYATSYNSHKQVGYLDVHPKDAWFFDFKTASQVSSNHWLQLEQRTTNSLNRYFYEKGIKEYKEIAKKKLDYQYEIASARKILFFDEVSDSATSAKVDTKDAWGIGWKLKWSVEAQTEPIANRLYTNVGAKYTDLVYTNSYGAKDMVLILDGKKCMNISVKSANDLTKCLLESKYNFLLTPFIVDSHSGKINDLTMAMELVQRQNPFAKMEASLKKQLEQALAEKMVGSYYLSFKESLVELKPSKIAYRGGPVALSQLSTKDERSLRGSGLFHIWIANKDNKDENSKSIIFKDWDQTKNMWVPSYFEYTHDLGYSLGSDFQALEINKLTWGKKFVENPGEFFDEYKGVLNFMGFELYHPDVWDIATFADGIWMARRIALLTTNQISEVAKTSKWPLFLQQLISWKLVKRAHDILSYFHPNYSAIKSRFVEPNVEKTLSLQKLLEQLKTQNELVIDEKNIFQAYIKWVRHPERNVMWNNQKFSTMTSEQVEAIIKSNWNSIFTKSHTVIDENMNVVDCTHSSLINFIEYEFWPNGFVNRLDRKKDNIERVCPVSSI